MVFAYVGIGIAILVAYLLGRLGGKRIRRKMLSDEIRSQYENMLLSLKYYVASLPMWESDAQKDYQEFKTSNESEGLFFMESLAGNHKSIQKYLMLLEDVDERTASTIEETISKDIEDKLRSVETEDSNYVERIRRTIDVDFRKGMIQVGLKNWAHFLERATMQEKYWETTKKWQVDHPYTS